MSDFGIVGAAYEAPSIYQDAQELINWYPETDPQHPSGDNPATPGQEMGRGVTALYPTPGLVGPHTTDPLVPLAGVPVRGFHVIPGGTFLFAACGNKLYRISQSYVSTYVGTLDTNTGRVYMCDNGASVYITDGASRYAYNWVTNVFGYANDGAFGGANVCGELDNYIFYNRPGTNQWGCTDVGSSASSALNFASKIGASSNITGMIACNRIVYLLGEKDGEAWQDVGTFPFPFAVIPGAMMQHGVVAQDSLSRLGESFAFLSRDDRGNNVVVQMVGFQPKRISTHAMENAFRQYSTTSDAIGMTYQQNGHEFYILTFPTADVTWCYDLATQLWHKRAWTNPNTGAFHRHRANCVVNFNGDILVGDWQDGSIYKFSLETFTDNGNMISCVRRAPHLVQDLKQQFYYQLQIQFQPGVGLQNGQGSNPQAMLRWSDDGGSTYGNIHTASIGQVGKYKNRCQFQRLGMARDRIFEVRVTDPVQRVIISADLKMGSGTT